MFSCAGSSANTSSATPAICPESKPALIAASSRRPPRAQFIMRTPSFILAIVSALIIFRVASVIGVCRLMKSARANSPSSATFSTPISVACSALRNGSNAMTFIFRPWALSATTDPMLPQPMIPKVFPMSSTPMKRDFSHLPAWVDAFASGI